jgi:hypothetical protein
MGIQKIDCGKSLFLFLQKMDEYFANDWKQKWYQKMLSYGIDKSVLRSSPNTDFSTIVKYDGNWHETAEGRTATSKNPSVTINDVSAHPIEAWDWNELSINKNIKIEDVLENVSLPWNWTELPRKNDFRLQHVLDNPDLPWNFSNMHHVCEFSIEFVKKFHDKNWSWSEFSYFIRSSSILIELIENFPDKPWNWTYLSCNVDIVNSLVLKYPDKPWDWYGISRLAQLFPNIVITLKDKPWKVSWLQNYNKKIFDIVRAMPDRNWSWCKLSYREDIPLDFVFATLHKPWNMQYICNHHFDGEKQQYTGHCTVSLILISIHDFYNSMSATDMPANTRFTNNELVFADSHILMHIMRC